MSTNVLRFVNHASFHIADEHTLLLIDPWVQGAAFNNGWRLLDQSTSNAALIADLMAHKQNIHIWFSHEHPDHFSISFIKQLNQDFPGKVTLLFQHTKDQRVAAFLRRNGFDVTDCLPGQRIALGPAMAISVFPFGDGDSWCLIESGGRTVLNLNDCAVDSAALCQAVQQQVARLAPRVDLLFTQFGYASWVGNPAQPELHRAAAAEKIHRIRLQIDAFKPRITVPFASFVSFASADNAYLNAQQNSARLLANWARQSRATDLLRFMKPGDEIDLAVDSAESLAWASDAAVEHWERLEAAAPPTPAAEPVASLAQIETAVHKHRKAINANLPGLAWLLEAVGLIHPLAIRLADLDATVRVSYIGGYRVLPPDSPWDISMNSPSALFLFNNEYGFNTTHVNGRFRTADGGALRRFGRFFMPQNLGRQGYGMQHPAATLRYLAANAMTRLARLARLGRSAAG